MRRESDDMFRGTRKRQNVTHRWADVPFRDEAEELPCDPEAEMQMLAVVLTSGQEVQARFRREVTPHWFCCFGSQELAEVICLRLDKGLPCSAGCMDELSHEVNERLQDGYEVDVGCYPEAADSAPSYDELAYRLRRLAAQRRLLEGADILTRYGRKDYDLPRILASVRSLQSSLDSVLEDSDQQMTSVSGAELLGRTAVQTRCVLGDSILPEQGVTLLAGPPKAGKSILALQLAIAVSEGTEFLGFPTAKGPVVYISGEGGEALVRDRMTRMRAQAGDDLHFIFPTQASLDGLVRTCKTYGAVLCIIDPLVKVHDRDENSTRDMSELMANLKSVRLSSGASMLLVHHTRKPSNISRPGSVAEARGSSVLHAEMDSSLMLSPRGADARSLHFELRWATSPPPILLELNSDPLGFMVSGLWENRSSRLSAAALCRLLEAKGPLTIRDVMNETKVCEKTVQNRLKELRGSGKVTCVGSNGAC